MIIILFMVTLSLCMMLKNEEHIIERCLNSVKDIIDSYFIADTGSTDNTKNVIKNFFDKYNIPGIIVDQPWVNFGQNRSMLVSAARDFSSADYLLLVDADYIINVFDKDFKNKLVNDGYYLKWEGGLDYKNVKLIKRDLKWKYFGPTHEYIRCLDREIHYATFDDLSITEHYDGGNRNDKFQRDIRLLLNEIESNPNDPDIVRYYFYLGRSYEDLGDNENALVYYTKRASIISFYEENYYAMWKIGECKLRLNYDIDEVFENYLEAHYFINDRLEAMYSIVKYCFDNKKYNLGYALGIKHTNKPYPSHHTLFVSKDVHTHLFDLCVAKCAYNISKYNESICLLINLLKKPDITNDDKYNILYELLTPISKSKIHSLGVSQITVDLYNKHKTEKDVIFLYYKIILFCRNNNLHDIGYELSDVMLKDDVDEKMTFYLEFEKSITAYHVQKYDIAKTFSLNILTYVKSNTDERIIIARNLLDSFKQLDEENVKESKDEYIEKLLKLYKLDNSILSRYNDIFAKCINLELNTICYELCDKLKDLTTDNNVMEYLAISAHKLGKYDIAIKVYKNVLLNTNTIDVKSRINILDNLKKSIDQQYKKN